VTPGREALRCALEAPNLLDSPSKDSEEVIPEDLSLGGLA